MIIKTQPMRGLSYLRKNPAMKIADILSHTIIFLVLIICFSCSKEENEQESFSKKY